MCNGHSPSLPNMTRKVWFLSLIRDLENCLVHIKKDHFEKIWESVFLSSSWSFRIWSQNIPSPSESNSVAGATIVSFSRKNQIGVLEFEVVRLKKDHFEKIWESTFLSSSWSFRNWSQNIHRLSECHTVVGATIVYFSWKNQIGVLEFEVVRLKKDHFEKIWESTF